ncbi:MAG: MarR family winged helix-turn-helix transcriptional regulator [Pseudomonadota bacterium]|nr:MarR family winged helix-turn-helix transcriptional regulator [Pseudomonadota bacterium]
MEFAKVAPSRVGRNDPFFHQAEKLRESLGSALKVVDQMAGAPSMRSPDQQVSQQEVRAILKMRRNRARFFKADLFADPAWDILLDLYAAELAQQRVAVTSACHAAAVPATTALRWIGQLEREGLINRRADPMDGRRQFLMLSNEGLEAMNAYFKTVPTGAKLI